MALPAFMSILSGIRDTSTSVVVFALRRIRGSALGGGGSASSSIGAGLRVGGSLRSSATGQSANSLTAKLTTKGLKQVSNIYRQMTVNINNLQSSFEEISEDFKNKSETHFDTEGASSGVPWEPLSPVTLRIKRILGFKENILEREGTLKDSLTGGQGYIEIIRPNQLIVGTGVSYAAAHQTGTNIGHTSSGFVQGGEKPTPERPVILVTQADTDRWASIINRHIGKNVRVVRVS